MAVRAAVTRSSKLIRCRLGAEVAMTNVYKMAVGIFVVLVLIAVAVYMIWIRPGTKIDEEVEAVPIATPLPAPTPTPTLAEQLSERLQGVTLNTADDIVSELVAELSSHPQLAQWLVNEDLVRRFTAAVENIANGTSPRKHIEFMRPGTPFRAIQKRGSFYVNPSSYARYKLVADVFTSLDTEGTIALYEELRPLIDEAYREISPPGWVFEDRLMLAIDHLVSVQVPTGEIELEERTVATFAYADDGLESLSDAQRHFMRMGPDNMRRIQSKLREFRNALEAQPPPEE
jgi:hypothetical protein